MVKKHDDSERLANFEALAKAKMERRLKGEEIDDQKERLERLKMSNIKQYRKEMRKIGKQKREEMR